MQKDQFINSYMSLVHDAAGLGVKLHKDLVDTSNYQPYQIEAEAAAFTCKLLLASLERLEMVEDLKNKQEPLRQMMFSIAEELMNNGNSN